MIEIGSWTREFAQRLRAEFGPRLLFIGCQGSYARGEATHESDVDIVAILDEADAAALERYRSVVGAMPQSGLACGFICGRRELENWPRYDLLSLALDTKPVVGELAPYLPEFTDGDRREALRIGAANLYHAVCHTYLYGDRERELPGLLKAAFFCLRLWALVREGIYCATRAELAQALTGRERRILDMLAGPRPDNADEAYSLLIDWSSEALRQT